MTTDILHTQYKLNPSKPRQNWRHYPDDIFQCIFFNENMWISIKISFKFVSKYQINNILALVKIMAWHQATNHCLNQWWLIYWRIFTSLGLNELMCNSWNVKHNAKCIFSTRPKCMFSLFYNYQNILTSNELIRSVKLCWVSQTLTFITLFVCNIWHSG